MYKPFFSLAVILVSVAFGFMYVKPQYERAQSQREAIVSLDETLSIADKIKLKIEGTKTELGNVSRLDSERFAVFLPEKIDTIRFANDLQHIGKTHRLTLSDIKIENPTLLTATTTLTDTQNGKGAIRNVFSLDRGVQMNDTEGGSRSAINKKYKTNKMSFSVSASYGDFLKLLADMERSLGLINITSLLFQPSDDANSGSNEQLYQYAIEIETYSLN